MLTPKEKEEIQEKIVLLCNAASRIGIPEERLLRDLHRYGFERLTLPEFDAEMYHLEKKALIATVDKTLRKDLRRWVTTSEGDEFLIQHGLI